MLKKLIKNLANYWKLLTNFKPEKYYQLVSGQVDLLLENLEIWLTGIEATRAMSSIEIRLACAAGGIV